MHAFSIRDLRERTGELVRNAEAGQLALISKHGKPLFVAVPFDENILQHGVHFSIAIDMFKERVISCGKAAKIARMPLEEFMEALSQLGIPIVDYDPQEVEQDLENIKKIRSRMKKGK